jgi:hypothetical protein
MTARYARIAVIAAFAAAVACGDPATAPTTPKNIARPILVDSVEVLLAPPSAHVRGVIGDACTDLSGVTMRRGDNDNIVDITIWSTRPQDAICSQIAKLYDATLALPGNFPPGPYVLRVNGVEKTFTIP